MYPYMVVLLFDRKTYCFFTVKDSSFRVTPESPQTPKLNETTEPKWKRINYVIESTFFISFKTIISKNDTWFLKVKNMAYLNM